MKKIFVTGGAGFIGSAFIRLVLRELPECEIVVFDCLTGNGNYDNLSELKAYGERCKFVYGDICNKYAVLSALDYGTNAIVNFAAESNSSASRAVQAAGEFVRTNVTGTQTLLDAARQRNVKRYVQISTDEVLGSLPDDDYSLFTENSPYAPNSPYAASKAAAEHFVRAARETFGTETIITRCGNSYGPRQFPEKMLPMMIANALKNQPIPIYGDGRDVRDWVYVEDHCRAILAALLNGQMGEIYNIGARNEHRVLDVAIGVLNLLGKPYSLIKFLEDRRGSDRRYVSDPSKIEIDLGWKPLETWESGLQKTINWYLENQDWLNRIKNGEYRQSAVRYNEPKEFYLYTPSVRNTISTQIQAHPIF